MWEDSTCGYAMLLLVSSLLHWNSQLQNHPPQGNITHVPQQYLRPSQQHEGLLIAPTQQASSDISEVTYWYPCSGATHHLTLELNNIMNKSQFSAPDQVFMGNGKGLPIHHIGNTSFSSPFNLSKSLTLKQLLHVLKITKNLLNVSKFANDNHVYFEFHPHLLFC